MYKFPKCDSRSKLPPRCIFVLVSRIHSQLCKGWQITKNLLFIPLKDSFRCFLKLQQQYSIIEFAKSRQKFVFLRVLYEDDATCMWRYQTCCEISHWSPWSPWWAKEKQGLLDQLRHCHWGEGRWWWGTHFRNNNIPPSCIRWLLDFEGNDCVWEFLSKSLCVGMKPEAWKCNLTLWIKPELWPQFRPEVPGLLFKQTLTNV